MKRKRYTKIFLSIFVAFCVYMGDGASSELRLKPKVLLKTDGQRLSSIAYSKSRDEIYVVDSLTGDIRVGKPDGGKFFRIESPGGVKAYAVASGETGELLVTDLVGRGVTKLDAVGRVIDRIELAGENSRLSLGRIRIGPSGKIYVVERSGRRIFIIDSELETFESLPLESSPDTLALVDVAFDRNASFFTVSSKGEVIRRYDSTGKYSGGFGKHGLESGSFSLPSACMFGPDGYLWVVDSFQHSIKVFETDGTFVSTLLEMDRTENGLFFPVDITFLGGKTIAILDKGTATVKVFEIEGAPER